MSWGEQHVCQPGNLSTYDLELIGLAIAIQAELTERKLMTTLQEMLAEEQAEGGEITNLVSAFNAQTQQILDLQAQIAALAPGTLTADQQSTLDSIFAQAESNRAAVAASLPANSPVPTQPSAPVDPGSIPAGPTTNQTAAGTDASTPDPNETADPAAPSGS